MKHKKASKGIFVDVAVLIVCLAIATSCLASGMFAKFVSKSVGADLARVASFNVDAIMSGGTEDTNVRNYSITLSNNSETAVRYTVVLTFNKDVSGIVDPKLNENTGTSSSDGTTTTFTWTNVGVIPPKHTPIDVPLVIEIINPAAGGEYDFDVSVSFEQVS